MKNGILFIGLLAAACNIGAMTIHNRDFTDATPGGAFSGPNVLSAEGWSYVPAGDYPLKDNMGVSIGSSGVGVFTFGIPSDAFLVRAFLHVGDPQSFDGFFAIRAYDSNNSLLLDDSVHSGINSLGGGWVHGEYLEIVLGTIAEQFNRIEVEASVPFVLDNVFYRYEGESVPEGGSTALLMVGSVLALVFAGSRYRTRPLPFKRIDPVAFTPVAD
jgi:hypothetical protein